MQLMKLNATALNVPEESPPEDCPFTSLEISSLLLCPWALPSFFLCVNYLVDQVLDAYAATPCRRGRDYLGQL